MIDDVTVAVTGPDHVLVTGGNPETEAALRAAAPAGTTVIERRDETAVLSLQGPNSRAVLESLTDADVSNSAFPYYTFRTGQTVAGIRATSIVSDSLRNLDTKSSRRGTERSTFGRRF